MQDLLTRVAKSVFRAVGLEIRRKSTVSDEKPWDRAFAAWIAEAEAAGKDPNDVGDAAWEGDPSTGARSWLLPHILPNSVVLELGPGTGRMTRHVLPHCKEMILVDYSQMVCNWLATYLKDKGQFRIFKLDGPSLSEVSDQAVDVAFAFGVFEHLDLDDLYCFLQEFHRVLRRGGIAWFNFDTLMSKGGLQWFHQERAHLKPGIRSVFRFYHPDMVHRLANSVGFDVTKELADDSRQVSIELKKR